MTPLHEERKWPLDQSNVSFSIEMGSGPLDTFDQKRWMNPTFQIERMCLLAEHRQLFSVCL
jgi:hypothetical protein